MNVIDASDDLAMRTKARLPVCGGYVANVLDHGRTMARARARSYPDRCPGLLQVSGDCASVTLFCAHAKHPEHHCGGPVRMPTLSGWICVSPTFLPLWVSVGLVIATPAGDISTVVPPTDRVNICPPLS